MSRKSITSKNNKKIGFDIEFELIKNNKLYIPSQYRNNIYKLSNTDDTIFIGIDGSRKCFEIRSREIINAANLFNLLIKKIKTFANLYKANYSFDSIFHPLGAHIHVSTNTHLLSTLTTHQIYEVIKPFYNYYSKFNINCRKSSNYSSILNAYRIHYDFGTIEIRFFPSSFTMASESNFIETIQTCLIITKRIEALCV